MNLLLVSRDEIDAAGEVLLDDRRAEHLRRVLKVEVGQRLRVGILGGGIGEGRVEAIDGEHIRLGLAVPEGAPVVSRVDLIVALPRPQALHRLLQTAATMAVGRLDLIKSWRVEKSFFSSPSLRPETVRRHLLLGAEQGGGTHVPEVAIHHRFVPFVESLGVPGETMRWVAHPGGRPLEPPTPAGRGRRIQLAVGPEGGWIDREIETLGQAGFEPIDLGPWILKVENAVTAALAQIDLADRLGGDRRGFDTTEIGADSGRSQSPGPC